MKTKVYVNIPANEIAGGVESLYQLVDAINTNGGYACVIWDRSIPDPIPSKYSHYKIIHGDPVEDSPENWVIYPEVWTEKLNTYPNMKNAIWWLSVDNNHGKFQDFSNQSITHFYQSYYALDFLEKNGVTNYLPIFDYIHSKYTDSIYEIDKKENIVCYNPVKGIEITNQIMSLNPDIKFVPIVNMTEDQIINLLKISKVYIDFGHHPGRDRIPRESAILGNCVLTNSKGSAGFHKDVPVDEKYKSSNIDEIGSSIRNCFENYEMVINEYSFYRDTIKTQKEELHNLAKKYFI
jgi:hypothetical protein